MATNNAAEMIPRIAIKGTLGVSGPLNSDYDALINKPQINGNELVGNKTNAELGIPTELADLTEDSTHRVVTDTQIGEWNAKSDFSGSYDDLTDVPEDLVEDAEYVHTDNNYTSAEKTKLGDIESGAEVNVQADWNETDTSSDAYIQNKPTIPAAQVNSDWNASSGVAEILHKPTLGTAAAKDYTGSVLENSTDLVESGAVKTAIDNAISSVYKPAGNKACAELVSALLVAANLGNVYNMTDDGVTTADFVEGAGKAIEAGDNVVIVDIGSSVYKFDLLSGMVDLSNYVQKSSTSGLIKNDGTIDQTAYAKQNEMSVSTSGDQTTIQLKNGTSAAVINAHQDISGKANKSEMSVTPGTGSDADKTTIQLKSGTSATVLKTHQDISGKADKVSGATNGNLAGLDANGNLTDSGIATTDVEEMQDELSIDTSTIEGNPINFSTLSAQKSKSTILSVEPIQDLHGFDKPWVGGAGKNLLPMTLAILKALNYHGTWNNNVYTYYNVAYTIQQDADGNIIGIDAHGQANADSTITLVDDEDFLVEGTSYILNGCPVGGSDSTYRIQYSNNIDSAVEDYGNGASFTEWNHTTYPRRSVRLRVFNGYNANHLKFYPMIRLSTESDATFEPYTNICPISGRSEIGILGTGKNKFDVAPKTTQNWDAIPGTSFYQDMYIIDDVLYTTAKGNGQSTIFRLKNFPSGVWSFNYKLSQPYNKRMIIRCFDKDGNNISSQTQISGFTYLSYYSGLYSTEKSPTRNFANIVIPNTVAYFNVGIGYVDDTAGVRVQISEIQLEKGSSATPYEHYQESNDLTISLGQTVYGGTLDVENGVLVANKVFETYNSNTGWETTNVSHLFRTYATVNYKKADRQRYANDGEAISNLSQVFYETGGNAWAQTNGVSLYDTTSNLQYPILYANPNISTLEELGTFLTSNPLEVCYELANPITINLTPHTINLLKGVNNISTDGDKITLTYRDGSVATLGDLTSAVDNLDSKIDESKILTDTATGDKYILVVTNGVLSVEQISN